MIQNYNMSVFLVFLSFIQGNSSLCATAVLNDRKMRPFHSAFQIIRFQCRNQKLILEINFNDDLLSFKLTRAGRLALYGQIGRHCVADISKSHREISKFFLSLGSYTFQRPLGT